MRKYKAYMRMYANFCICGIIFACAFENVIICGKICYMWNLAKYAIAHSHKTGIPIQSLSLYRHRSLMALSFI